MSFVLLRVSVFPYDPGEYVLASIVSPSAPRLEVGYNWGFTVRQASSISKVLLECPYNGGYDLTIGTSERGEDVAELVKEFPAFR